MALECLTILGSKNEQLYVQLTNSSRVEENAEEDVFGFSQYELGRTSLSIRQEVREVFH